MVVVREVAGGADAAMQGARVHVALKEALSKEMLAILSFAGIQTTTSSFVNTAIVPLISDLSLDVFKARVRIVESTRQINEMIRARLGERSPSYWWGSNRINERDLRIPALRAMAARKDGYISTSDLIDELEAQLRPQGDDAMILSGRNDSRFSQIVRNLKSHKSSPSSIFANGYAEDLKDGMRITDAGRAYLASSRD